MTINGFDGGSGPALLAGGDFSGAGRLVSSHIAVWSCQGLCPADVSPMRGDDTVNVDDLLVVITSWGPCLGNCPPHCAADIDHNCMVNVDDLLAVINGWGQCP